MINKRNDTCNVLKMNVAGVVLMGIGQCPKSSLPFPRADDGVAEEWEPWMVIAGENHVSIRKAMFVADGIEDGGKLFAVGRIYLFYYKYIFKNGGGGEIYRLQNAVLLANVLHLHKTLIC